MYILAIETTGAYASAAVTDGDKILAHVEGNDRYSHLQNLMPQIEQVLEASGSSIGDMTAIAVSAGPGSFTGIRIGVSSARALSQILHIPCVPVSSLEALTMRAAGLADEETVICPMLDARRKQVYAGAYQIKDGALVSVVEAGPYTVTEFLEMAREKGPLLLTGDGVDLYDELIRQALGDYQAVPEELRYQDAETVALLGARLYRQTGGVAYEQLKPEYMRIPEAERKLKEKQGKQNA